MNVLWVYAHPKEAAGLELPSGLELGVGKIEATLSLARRLAQDPPAAVVNFGVAGAWARSGLDVGDVCLVVEETLADEGVATADGFEDLRALRLAERVLWSADAALTDRLAATLPGIARVRGTTVSTCSGTDALAQAYAERTQAAVETMEGAAVARVCEAFGVPWAQVRAISNRTGDRDRGGWDLRRAKTQLHAAMQRLLEQLA